MAKRVLTAEERRQRHRERVHKSYMKHRKENLERQKLKRLKANPKIEKPIIKITMDELLAWIRDRHKYGDPAKYDWMREV